MTIGFGKKEALLLMNSFTKGGLMKYNRSYTTEDGTYVKEYKLIKDGKVLSVAAAILHENYFEVKLITESDRHGFSVMSYTKNL